MTIEETVALKGGKYADSGATVTGTQATNYRYLVVNEDAVFTTLTDMADTDIIAEWGISGKTLKSGMILAPASKLAFKTVTVASGSVLLIKL
jgi:hypothetical protein